ncbi:MAG: hypothetical protein K9M49_09440 [Candidatus Marinimicrobia bacterium]|nr:hypothetical protein [Candidatus Neomarinimicrobiota bacterium]MCF7851595.1 hypothetical protein [Candidatus Neomarinimicrobiota bacterium]MCF7905355.1 hypothetical protein [Candidatus Neomarinimicrobiota bacterium]
MKRNSMETRVTSRRMDFMVKYFSILFLPLVLFAESVSYGEDPFILGMSIDAYAMGNIKALPMSSPSPGASSASRGIDGLSLGFQHTEGFGGVYQTDVLSGAKDRWSLLLFRGGVGNIPDTRDALLDYGTDGVAGTEDSDGTEGNGQLDPGERLSINSINYFSTQQFLAELGYSYPLSDKLLLNGTARMLFHDLYAESGFGVGFHAGVLFEPTDKLRLGLQVTDMLSTVIFWSSGQTEVYKPQIYAGLDYLLAFRKIPFTLHPILQLEIPVGEEVAGLNQESYGVAGGVEIIFQNQLHIQIGQNALDQLQIGALIRTSFLDIQYGTGFSELSKLAGQTHRVGVRLHLSKFDLF